MRFKYLGPRFPYLQGDEREEWPHEMFLESHGVEMYLATVRSHQKQEARCPCVSNTPEEGKER